jgi:4-diphosphocytidyl-2-C-methyl-D-erythritol kinase
VIRPGQVDKPGAVPASAQARAVSALAPAKINLFLHVGEMRPDHYHALQSLVVFAELGDRMEFSHAASLTLRIGGAFAAQVPKGEDNLILKAARKLAATASAAPGGAIIALEKSLPVAAGIGGGSADAAATLRGLNLLWGLNRPESELLDLAAEIGSDVPACLLSRPCWMEGRGEQITRTPALPNMAAILVNPGVVLPTRDVFAALNARTGVQAMPPPPPNIQTLWDVVGYLDDAGNDLEAPACQLHPVIDEVLDALNEEPGCVLSQMSGSGATCFGLFDGQQFALGAAERIAQDHPNWWVRATRIASPDIGAPHWKA